ncbi:MAG: NAD-dependent epimerase/dehydratase, partial [uncultured Blastococcus sp.]
ATPRARWHPLPRPARDHRCTAARARGRHLHPGPLRRAAGGCPGAARRPGRPCRAGEGAGRLDAGARRRHLVPEPRRRDQRRRRPRRGARVRLRQQPERLRQLAARAARAGGERADLEHRRRRVRAEQGLRRAGDRRGGRRRLPHRTGRAHRRPVRQHPPAGLVARAHLARRARRRPGGRPGPAHRPGRRPRPRRLAGGHGRARQRRRGERDRADRDDHAGRVAGDLPEGDGVGCRVGAGARCRAARRRRRGVDPPPAVAAGRRGAHHLGRRHHHRARARAADPPAPRVGGRHLVVAARRGAAAAAPGWPPRGAWPATRAGGQAPRRPPGPSHGDQSRRTSFL